MPGDYTGDEISGMTPSEFAAAQKLGWRRIENIELPETIPSVDPNAWSANAKAETEGDEDFIVPSGQKCRLRKLTPEALVKLGILDRVTRLEGLAQTLVDRSSGLPPTATEMPTREEFEVLLETMNLLMPLAIAEPKVYADDDAEAPDGAIRVHHIDLDDRIAIMERALRKLKSLDRFRHA